VSLADGRDHRALVKDQDRGRNRCGGCAGLVHLESGDDSQYVFSWTPACRDTNVFSEIQTMPWPVLVLNSLKD